MSGIAAPAPILPQGQPQSATAGSLQPQASDQQTIRALVAAITAQGLATLLVDGKPIHATLPAHAAKPGAWLTLAKTTMPDGTAGYRMMPAPADMDVAAQKTLRAAASHLSEASLARMAGTPVTATPPAVEQAPVASPPLRTEHEEALAAAVDRSIAKAVTGQRSLTNLIGMAQALAAEPPDTLPKPVLALTQAIASQGLDGNRPITAQALSDSVARSGLFHEARLAQPIARTDMIRQDIKGLFLALNALLTSLGDDEAKVKRPASGQEFSQAPPLPRRDAMLLAEKAAMPPVQGLTDPANTVFTLETLSQETEGALDRIRLQQHASLPENAPGASHTGIKTAPQVLMLEIPLILQQGMTMVQMRFSGGGQGAAGRDPGLGWRVEFSLDAGEVGPVHADIGLRGEAVAVTLHVEDGEAAIAMRAEAEALADLLAEEGLESGMIRILTGRPTVKPGAGYYLDHKS
jgi:hypothetical protein